VYSAVRSTGSPISSLRSRRIDIAVGRKWRRDRAGLRAVAARGRVPRGHRRRRRARGRERRGAVIALGVPSWRPILLGNEAAAARCAIVNLAAVRAREQDGAL